MVSEPLIIPAVTRRSGYRFPARLLKRGFGLCRRHPVIIALALVGFSTVLFAGYTARQLRHFRQHLGEARKATAEGRTSAALAQLSLCERIDAEDPDAMILSARVFRMLLAWQRTDELLERYWTLHGDDERLTFERLLLKAARDSTDSVALLLRSRIAAGGESAIQARHALVSGYIREFRYADAEIVLRDWKAESPGDPLADLLQGKIRERMFNFEGAQESYEAILARCTDHHEARLRLVQLLMQRRQADVALTHLKILRATMPENVEVASQWAFALRQVGRTEEATRSLEETLAKYPNYPPALIERGSIALNAGEDDRAAEVLALAVRIDPGSISARALYAQALTRLGRDRDAAEELRIIKSLTADGDRLTELIHGPLQSRPNDPSAPFEIAGIALRSGQPDEAIHWYHIALKRDPNHRPSHTALAVIYLEMGNPVLATKHRAMGTPGSERK